MPGKHRFTAAVILLILAPVAVALFGPGSAPADAQTSVPATQTITLPTTTRPVTGPMCDALKAQGYPCLVEAGGVITITVTSAPGTSLLPSWAGTSLDMLDIMAVPAVGEIAAGDPLIAASGPNYVCQYDSCNGGSGTFLASDPCGTTYTGSEETWVRDGATQGHLWHSNVSYQCHGTLCQSAYFDSVDCGDHGGTGYTVTINWCSSFNNGAGSPYNYTDAGDHVTVSLLVNGFPVSNSYYQRFDVDVYANWGFSSSG
jgi:hypothetical protein